MELVYQVATLAELGELLALSEAHLIQTESDEQARMFYSWHAPWRRESLEHYLKFGWSFTARHRLPADQRISDPAIPGKLAGYFLAQPFLFMRGMTQTLWVEHIAADSEATRAGLIDVAVRMGRDKHLQRVLFHDALKLEPVLQAGNWKPRQLQDVILEVPTTKG